MYTTKLHVGNLPYEATESDLYDFFTTAGPVRDALVMIDRRSGRSRGFGFVSMISDVAARNACENLNNRTFRGRAITVKIARTSEERLARRS